MDKERIQRLIDKVKGVEEEEETGEDEEMQSEGMEVAAREMMDAMQTGNTDGFMESLANFIKMVRL